MITYSGKELDVRKVDNSTAENISIIDIAEGLTRLCCFNGQCSEFYTYAERALNLKRYFEERGLLEHAYMALLLDAVRVYNTEIPECSEEFRAMLWDKYWLSTDNAILIEVVKVRENVLRTVEAERVFPKLYATLDEPPPFPKLWTPLSDGEKTQAELRDHYLREYERLLTMLTVQRGWIQR